MDECNSDWHQPTTILSLPNMFTARARNCIGRFLLRELLFADRAGLGHNVRHNSHLSPRSYACPYAMHVEYQRLQFVGRARPITALGKLDN